MPSRLCVDTHACARTSRASRSHMCNQRTETRGRDIVPSVSLYDSRILWTAFWQGSSRALSTRFSALSIGCRARETLAHSWQNSRRPAIPGPDLIHQCRSRALARPFTKPIAERLTRFTHGDERFVDEISEILRLLRRLPQGVVPSGIWASRRSGAHALSLSLSSHARGPYGERLRPARTRVWRGERKRSKKEKEVDGGMKRWRMIISRSKESRFEKFAIRNSANHPSDTLRVIRNYSRMCYGY